MSCPVPVELTRNKPSQHPQAIHFTLICIIPFKRGKKNAIYVVSKLYLQTNQHSRLRPGCIPSMKQLISRLTPVPLTLVFLLAALYWLLINLILIQHHRAAVALASSHGFSVCSVLAASPYISVRAAASSRLGRAAPDSRDDL